MLDHSRMRHVLANLGGPGEMSRGQIPVSHQEIAQARIWLGRARLIVKGNPEKGIHGHPRFEALTEAAGARYTMIGQK
jgi:hypothetical protein